MIAGSTVPQLDTKIAINMPKINATGWLARLLHTCNRHLITTLKLKFPCMKMTFDRFVRPRNLHGKLGCTQSHTWNSHLRKILILMHGNFIFMHENENSMHEVFMS